MIILIGLIIFNGCTDNQPADFHADHDHHGTAETPQPPQSPEQKEVVRENGVVIIDMFMSGSSSYSDPVGIHVEPGTTIRFVNRTGMHSATAYHRDNGFPDRIPPTAQSWDSGLLTRRGEIFEITLTVEGVYDYLCVPHEAAGHVGRIIVGNPEAFMPPDESTLPQAVRTALPTVEAIIALGAVWN